MTNQTAIPGQHISFCKAIAKLATEAGYDSLSVSFKPGFYDVWQDPIGMRWESGRHGDNSTRVVITSTVTVRATTEPEHNEMKR